MDMFTSYSESVDTYYIRYIVGFWLVEMAISTNQKPTIYRNLYENTGPGSVLRRGHVHALSFFQRISKQMF